MNTPRGASEKDALFAAEATILTRILSEARSHIRRSTVILALADDPALAQRAVTVEVRTRSLILALLPMVFGLPALDHGRRLLGLLAA